MSVWSENPEWFDEWLEQQAGDGRFDNHPDYGAKIQQLVADGDFCGWQWWDKLDTDGKLGQEAIQSFYERLIP